MTKAALCVDCFDIVSPRRAWQSDRSWRWCECDHTAVRWRDGDQGLLEVSSLYGPDRVRVVGLNNSFLVAAVQSGDTFSTDEWRTLHDGSCEVVESHYLFHKDRRACWALVVRVGESGDVTFVPYGQAHVDTPLRSDDEEIAAIDRRFLSGNVVEVTGVDLP